jgi:oleate hydratase
VTIDANQEDRTSMTGSTASQGKHGSPAQSREHITAYLIGGGIAALAAAVYLIRDGHLTGQQIHILTEDLGGSLDASGSAKQGYLMRGTRMFGAAYVLTYDLLAQIPCLHNPDKSVLEDTFEFWAANPWNDKARLVSHGEIVDLSSWSFSNEDRLDLMRLMLFPEDAVGTRQIDECFGSHFFETNFWMMWCSMFGFETWHSAVELRRYLLRFLRLFPDLETMKIIQTTRHNGYDSIIRPIVSWLEERGVRLEVGTQVTDLDFEPGDEGRAVRRLQCLRSGTRETIDIGERDLVIATLGSMTSGSSIGSMTSAPVLETGKSHAPWAFWQRLAEKDPAFGRPATFCGHVDRTKWVTFTVTDASDAFVRRMERFSGSEVGRGGLTTLTSSSWLLTVHLYHPPAYPTQRDDVFVWWGYGLFPDRTGDYVEKKMSECSGKEILEEVYSHLGFQADMPTFLETANCIPCLLPYTTSQFMPRAPGDRPEVIPAGTVNLALIGQYVEIPDDVVYTIEYSIRSARLAVTALLGLTEELPETYKGLEHPSALVTALKRILA